MNASKAVLDKLKESGLSKKEISNFLSIDFNNYEIGKIKNDGLNPVVLINDLRMKMIDKSPSSAKIIAEFHNEHHAVYNNGVARIWENAPSPHFSITTCKKEYNV